MESLHEVGDGGASASSWEERLLKSPRWHQSATLAERGQALREWPLATEGGAEGDRARAERRLSRWRSKSPFDQEDSFSRRLAQDGLDEARLLHLLGEPASALASRHGPTPDWVSRLVRLLLRPRGSGSEVEQMTRPLSPVAAAQLTLLQPLITDGRARLEQRLRERVSHLPSVPFDPAEAVALLLPYLGMELSEIQARTLALELNIARVQNQLTGQTAQERFQSFVDRLSQPEVMLALLAEYPVLARRLVTHVDLWVSTNLELLERLARDFDEIRSLLSPGQDPGPLTGCQLGAGDPHRGGHTVALLTFRSGLRVVYKPRSLAVETHFQELLAWLNARGATPSLRATRVLERGSYGWVEHVERQSCHSVEEVRRFYERQGSYLAVMHVLAATDAHCENIIAAGEHPVFIDLESVFHTQVPVKDVGGSSQQAFRALRESVLSVGLLPMRSWADDLSEGIDFSGLGASTGQLTPKPSPTWDRIGTDEMRLIRKRVEVEGSANLPLLDGVEVGVLPYVEEFERGFTRMYRLLAEHREELLADDGPLARFAQDENRAILRPTYVYHLMLRESSHPDHLRDALDLDRFLDRLWATAEHMPYTRRLIPFEREALWQGDIPLFTSRPSSRDLWSSTGVRLPDYFACSGLDLSRRCIEQLSEKDLSQQLWFIEASFGALSVSGGGARMPSYRLNEKAPPASRERLLERATALGDRLASLAYRAQGGASWLGLKPVTEKYWSPSLLGMDLYSGLPGVMLFLAQLGARTGQERFTELAREAASTVREEVASSDFWPENVGAFGDGGVLHAWVHLGALWNEPALWDEAEAFLARLPERIARDKHRDVFLGAAGCLLVLLRLHGCRPAPRALELAVQCGDQLLASAQPMARGLGWVTPLGPQPLAGLSHGASGIAWALFELAAATGEERFRTAARGALEYERSCFSPDAGNWKDLRAESAEGGFMTAVCHGAPGVGLARLRMLPYLDAGQAREEISVAVATTLREGFGGNHSVCHGDLGNLEFVLLAEQFLGNEVLAGHRARLTAAILDSIDGQGVLCGVPSGVETPGFMTGLAGVGYSLLRLAEPERVPSLLTLEPPSRRV